MKPLVMTSTLVTEDGVPIDAVHLPALWASQMSESEELAPPTLPPDREDLVIVIAHGFTQSWQSPLVWKIAQRFNRVAGVVTFDFRGHGRSGGLSTLGDKEVSDLDVAVRYARELGYAKVATVGFSMGAGVVLRHAALHRGVDAVVSVSGPGRWYFRDTKAMRRVHFAAEKRLGRMLARRFFRTRISPNGWPVTPLAPADAASMVAPVPLLVVQGDCDPYFPPDHGRDLYDAARDPREFWLLPGFGHAELATNDALADRFAAWVMSAVAVAVPGSAASLGALRTISAGEATMSGSRASTGPLPMLGGQSS